MRWGSCGLRWVPWAAVLMVILCRELALPGKAKSIRPFTRCSAGTGQGHSHRPGRRPRSPEGQGAAALGVPGVYLPTLRGPPGFKTPSLPLPTRDRGPWRSPRPPTPAGFWNAGPLAQQEAPHGPDLRWGLAAPAVGPALGRAHTPALGSPGKPAWLRWALAGAEVGASRGVPVTSLPAGAPRAPISSAVSRGAGGQARDELRGQPPRDAPQVQLLPQQGLELPAAALGTTKGRVGTARGRRGRGEGPAFPRLCDLGLRWRGAQRQAGPSARRC